MSDEAHAQAAEVAVDRELRLRKVEDDLKKLQPKKKDGWERLQAMSPLLGGVLVAIVTYFLSGSVTNAIQRQQLQLSNVKEMRDLLDQLDKGAGEGESAAFTLSAFGPPAVPALMAALLSGGVERAPAAERALWGIGLSSPQPVCDLAARVLDNRSGRITWISHVSVMRLLGDLQCRDARATVEAYARAVAPASPSGGDADFASRFTDGATLDSEAVDQLKNAAARTLRMIRQ